jgi:hypothetical protein
VAKIGYGLQCAALPFLIWGGLLLGMSFGRASAIGEGSGALVMMSGVMLLGVALFQRAAYAKAHPFQLD